MTHCDQEEWVKTKFSVHEFENKVCPPVTQSVLKEIVGKHKDTRASWIDEIPTKLSKNASTRPDVDGRAVPLLAQQQLRRAVPQGYHFVCVRALLVFSLQ